MSTKSKGRPQGKKLSEKERTELMDYIVDNPAKSNADIAESFGVSGQTVANYRQKVEEHHYEEAEECYDYEYELVSPLEITLDIPEEHNGVTVKIKKSGSMVGTLHITETGMKFLQSHGKKMPENEVKWEMLRLFQGIEG